MTGEPGVRQEFRDGGGALLDGEHRESSSLTWWDSVPPEIGWGKSGRIVLLGLVHRGAVRAAPARGASGSAR